ncbi:MAG TPA: hypothetical protein PLQ13_08650, partial [Candidatus Krumholzibacteria bacterium]|nr:hypothetical protein [Candidatus Krumholzibacteria bacterium]
MNRMLISLLVGLALVAAPAGAAIITVDGGGGANYSTIQAAIDAAADGDIIQVADGTYAESLNVYKPLSIFGASEAGTIIDASGFNDYAIDASSNDPVAFAFADFTLIGNPAYTTAFGLKVSGDDVTVDVQRVTVQGCYRTGLNFNGLAGGVVTDCTATGTVYGVGLGMANCSNMTVSGLTTSGNAWAGMAVYADGTYYTGGSDNVVLTGTNTFGEPVALYTEEADGFFVTNFQVSTADFGALTGNNMNPAAVAYVPTVALAQTGVLGTDPVNGWVIDRADGSFAVAAGMIIQAAIDAASPGDVINVTAGTYTEALTVNKHVSIIGAGSAAGTGTVITQTAAGAGDSQIGVVNLAASGASALDPILLRSLRIEPVGISGLNVGRFTQATGTMVAFVALDDVAVVGTNLNPGSEQERGLYVDLTSSL